MTGQSGLKKEKYPFPDFSCILSMIFVEAFPERERGMVGFARG